MTRERTGLLLCGASALGFGATGVLAINAYAAGLAVVPLLALRFVLAALLLWPLALTRGRVPLRTLGAGVALGAGGYALQSGLLFASLTRIDVGLASMLAYAYPAFVLLAALALGRERADARKLAALGAATGGVLLVLAGGGLAGEIDGLGALLALGSGLAYAGYILVSDVVARGASPLGFAASVCTGAAMTFVLAAVVRGDLAVPDPAALGWAAAIAVVGTVVPIAGFLAGLARLGPSSASIASTIEPVFTVALAAVCLGQVPVAAQVAGGALVLVAVLALQLKPRRRPTFTQDTDSFVYA